MKAIKDPLVTYIEANADIQSIIGSYFPDWMDISQNVLCPFHDDNKTRSLHVSPSGKGYCHGCGHKIRDVIDLVSQMEGCERNEAKRILYADITKAIPDSEVEAYVRNLWKNNRALKWLRTERNLLDSTIRDYKIGYEPRAKRITIPIYDQFGCCVNIRRMGWLKNQKQKALNVKGRGEVRLYPERDVVLNRKLVLVEGEWDCLVAKQFGLPAVTWTGGANSWNKKYENMFKDKIVWICYDGDKAGEDGAELANEELFRIASHRFVVLHNDNKDITDWSFKYPNNLSTLALEINSFKNPKWKKNKQYCPYCGQEIKK